MRTMIPMTTPLLPEGALAWKVTPGEDDSDPAFPITSVGPWTDEPDKAQWVDPETGLDCLIVRNRMGSLCGYVGVPSDHVAYGKFYDDVPVQVHGGLTYGDLCQESDEDGPSPGICHVPLPGRPHDVYWLGFDCGHSWDLQPGLIDWERERGFDLPKHNWPGCPETKYRDLAYVVDEISSLARQLASVSV